MFHRISTRMHLLRVRTPVDLSAEQGGKPAHGKSITDTKASATTTSAKSSLAQFKGLAFTSATHQVTGTRHVMEDFHVSGAMDESTALFGVFDGHGGPACARYFSERLARLVRTEFEQGRAADESAWPRVLQESLAVCGRAWDGSAAAPRGSGCVAGVLLVSGLNVALAHVGDVGAACSSPGPTGHVALTRPHRSSDEGERARIEAAGGHVSQDGRLCGVLAPSRAFGDLDLRGVPGGQSLVSDPDMRSFAVELDESGQAFLVLASDGVWDVLSPAQACKIVAAALRMHGSASAAAKALAASAARSNLDDVTVTVLWWAL